MPDIHAFLSASTAHRWIPCPPSARLCEKIPEMKSSYTEEGSEAHALGEFKIKTAFKEPCTDPRMYFKFYNDEMEECAKKYSEFVINTYKSLENAVIYTEKKVDFSKWVPEGFGTADCIIATYDTLNIIDYKHGLGVLVDAAYNPQMMCYALGALEMFNTYDIQNVNMTIFQPRRNNISKFNMSKNDLLHWADNKLKVFAELAFKGKGEYKSGSWCFFCKGKDICPLKNNSAALKNYETDLSSQLGDFLN